MGPVHKALFYDSSKDGSVRCRLCRHSCLIAEGRRGLCGVRENRNGVLYALTYERCVARHLDPIEKKPLFHFLPGSKTYSIASAGCNFKCRHCQNWQISQVSHNFEQSAGGEYLCADVVSDAVSLGAASIAYTYTEPTVFYEYAFDVARMAGEKGIKNVFVTNGYTSAEPLKEVAPFLNAANIDLKSFSDKFYSEVCGARLKGVIETILLYRKLGIWIELTTLLIPDYNDSPQELKDIANFIKGDLGDDVPWHITAFYPTYKLTDSKPTPVNTIRISREIGLDAGLKFVYAGNVHEDRGQSTYCPHCGVCLIERLGYEILSTDMKDGKCGKCGKAVAGVWS